MDKILIEMFLENKDVLNQASPESIEKLTSTSYLITYDADSKFENTFVIIKFFQLLTLFIANKNSHITVFLILTVDKQIN